MGCLNNIAKYLNQRLVGNVYDGEAVLEAYSTDRSVLKITPKFVAVPENTEDVQELVKFSNDLAQKNYQLPITVRGSGLDKTGADLGTGLIISTEHLNKVQEIDEKSRLVRVQAGVTMEKLNSVLAVYGLHIPVDVNPKETIGGLISNFPTDPTARKYGSIYYYVDRIEVVLSNGDLAQTVSYTKRGLEKAKQNSNFEGQIYRELTGLFNEKFDVLEDIAGAKERDFAGYRMAAQVQQNNQKIFDLMPLFFASQGTLGVITEVILRAEPIAHPATRIVASFNSIRPALDYLYEIATLKPTALDIYDARIFKSALEYGKKLSILNPQLESGFYVVITFDDSHFKVKNKVKKTVRLATKASNTTVETPDNTEEFQELASALSAYYNDELEGERITVADNSRLPSDQLPSFVAELRNLEQTFDFSIPFYGSFATNNYHVRPDVQLGSVGGRQTAVNFLKAYSDLVSEHKGSITGSIAEGRTKGVITTPNFSDREREFYQQIKQIFDPHNILNPDVKMGAKLSQTVRYLRKDILPGISEQ